MSYAASEALQVALFDLLTADAGLAALVGSAIYDAPPAGSLPDLYVTLGAEAVRDRSDASGGAARHDVVISVVSSAAGFRSAKAAAVAVSDVLDGARPSLARGRVVACDFLKARAARTDGGALRRIDLTFRVRVDTDQP